MRERINAALKQAMLDQDKRRVSTLRLINAAIKDRDIAARSAGRDPVGAEDFLEILMKMIKQRLESARLYEEGHRLDLAEQEREEIAIIKTFLPKQLEEDEVRSVCAEAIKTTGAHGLRDMGRCMQALKERYAGRMDFGKASQIVKQQLG
ncbi:MAG: GatB/YqeY domain-containing protein [Bauldia sp.]|jgi:uncharacterized protein YqeY|nr:MAG: GatB/YqeY domain-containing protein [Bauldia sp.]MBZ0227590.1 GatB/YqeY domain-containing protein [Bauldia sp.]